MCTLGVRTFPPFFLLFLLFQCAYDGRYLDGLWKWRPWEMQSSGTFGQVLGKVKK